MKRSTVNKDVTPEEKIILNLNKMKAPIRIKDSIATLVVQMHACTFPIARLSVYEMSFPKRTPDRAAAYLVATTN